MIDLINCPCFSIRAIMDLTISLAIRKVILTEKTIAVGFS